MILYIQSLILILFLSFLNTSIYYNNEYDKDLRKSICSAVFYKNLKNVDDSGISEKFFKKTKIKKKNINYHEMNFRIQNYHKNTPDLEFKLYNFMILNPDAEIYIDNIKFDKNLIKYYSQI